ESVVSMTQVQAATRVVELDGSRVVVRPGLADAVTPKRGREGNKERVEVRSDGFVATIATVLTDSEREIYERGFAGLHEDCRFHDLVMTELRERFEHFYLVLAEESEPGRPIAVQPAFVVREDLLTGMPAGVMPLVRGLRRLRPNALNPKMLMVGCA